MSDAHKDALQLDFERRLKLKFHGTKVTSDAGLLAYRELDEALGLTTMTDSELCDNRTGKNMQHSIAALLRQSRYTADWQTTKTPTTQSVSVPTLQCGMLLVAWQ